MKEWEKAVHLADWVRKNPGKSLTESPKELESLDVAAMMCMSYGFDWDKEESDFLAFKLCYVSRIMETL